MVEAVHKANVKKPVTRSQKLDDFDKGVVRSTIYEMHRKKSAVTMPKLHKALMEKDIAVSLSTVARTVKALGFR